MRRQRSRRVNFADEAASSLPRLSGAMVTLPDVLTHYYHEVPFRSLTEVAEGARSDILDRIRATRKLPRRLCSAFYFEQRLAYERMMREQFVAKGGQPERTTPLYAILGESEIWARIYRNAVRARVAHLPPESVSFTYTDSFAAYVDRDLDGNEIPRKPQYGMVYRLEELPDLIHSCGWPGDRWKTEENWAHDLYVEAQIWSDSAVGLFT